MKILISGACGFVGVSIARALSVQHPDWELVGIDNFSRSGAWMNKEFFDGGLNMAVHWGDIRNASDLELLPACDWVIDAAAFASVLSGVDGKSSSRQLVENNLIGTLNLLEYCKQHSAGFVLLSTSRVYSIASLVAVQFETLHESSRGGSRFEPKEQTFPPGIGPEGVNEHCSTAAPASLYGTTKIASEQLALEYGYTFGFPVWINRCGVMAGPGQFGHPAQGIAAFWIHSFAEGRSLGYIGFDGCGSQVRDFLHPEDLVALLERQIAEPARDVPRIVNLGGGLVNSYSLAELSVWCRRRFPESKTPDPQGERANRPYDIPWMVMDCSLAGQIWDWAPKKSAEDIFSEIADFSLDHPEWLKMTTR